MITMDGREAQEKFEKLAFILPSPKSEPVVLISDVLELASQFYEHPRCDVLFTASKKPVKIVSSTHFGLLLTSFTYKGAGAMCPMISHQWIEHDSVGGRHDFVREYYIWGMPARYGYDDRNWENVPRVPEYLQGIHYVSLKTVVDLDDLAEPDKHVDLLHIGFDGSIEHDPRTEKFPECDAIYTNPADPETMISETMGFLSKYQSIIPATDYITKGAAWDILLRIWVHTMDNKL